VNLSETIWLIFVSNRRRVIPVLKPVAAGTMALHLQLVEFTDDVLLDILRFLTAQSLACLECSGKRFAVKTRSASAGPCRAPGAGSAVAARQAETWSLVEEAARRWILKCSDQRAWVPRREIYDETWGGFLGWERFLGLMREVEALRRAAVFGQSLEDWATRAPIQLGQRPYSATKSRVKMRAGCHRARFTVASQPHEMLFGVVRPDWDMWKGPAAENVPYVGHCFYHPGSGLRYTDATCESSWAVRQQLGESGERWEVPSCARARFPQVSLRTYQPRLQDSPHVVIH
jgi:hypothetical protein